MELFGLLFAGHDTSSHTLTTMLYYFLKRPECGKAVKDELKNAVGNGRIEDLTLAQLNELPKLNYFLKESLRIDPATNSSIPYSVKRRTTICGVDLPKGTMISL